MDAITSEEAHLRTADGHALEPAIGYQRWDAMLFLHWPLPVAALRPLVPPRLDLDAFDGRAWVSFAAFTVVGGRLRLTPPLPRLSTFHELNVRTYVRLEGEPGIWFFSLDAASPIASLIARSTVRLPYFAAHMEREHTGEQWRFFSQRQLSPRSPASFDARWKIAGPPRLAEDGSLEHFLCERYVLFSKAVGRKLWRGQVRHRPWPLQDVSDLKVQQNVDESVGLPRLRGQPLAHFAEGVYAEFLPFRVV